MTIHIQKIRIMAHFSLFHFTSDIFQIQNWELRLAYPVVCGLTDMDRLDQIDVFLYA